jgi:hypothetical protein
MGHDSRSDCLEPPQASKVVANGFSREPGEKTVQILSQGEDELLD